MTIKSTNLSTNTKGNDFGIGSLNFSLRKCDLIIWPEPPGVIIIESPVRNKIKLSLTFISISNFLRINFWDKLLINWENSKIEKIGKMYERSIFKK